MVKAARSGWKPGRLTSGGSPQGGEELGGGFERHPIDDNALMFVFQSKLFNIQADYDTEKFLRAVMFVDAHMQPYYDRWKTRVPEAYNNLWDLPIPKPEDDEIHYGYEDLRKRLQEKYYILKHIQKGEKKVKLSTGEIVSIRMEPEQIDYELAVEWYRLLRLLFLRIGILPKGFVEDDIR